MKPLHLARLVGTQGEMGAQHGRLVSADAQRLLEFYRAMPARQLAGGERGAAGTVARSIINKLATAWQARLVRDRPVELSARSRAFMAACGAPDDAELAFATMDSMQNAVSLIARVGLGPFASQRDLAGVRDTMLAMIGRRAAASAAPACSTIVAWGDRTEDGELMFARNFDFPGVGVWDEAPAFTVCVPDRGQRYGFFAARGADTAVVTVVNEAGLVLAPHTRWHRGVTWGGAMIVDVVHDIARKAETLADASRIARERPVSSSWGIAIGSGRERSACILEIAGPALEVVTPSGDFLVCANRYRTPSLQRGQIAASAAWGIHSERRERRLRELVGARRALTPRDLAGFLGDRHDVDAPAIRRHLGAVPAQPTNVHAAVVRPTRSEAWVGVDRAPTCEGQWAHLAWRWDDRTAGGWELGAHDGSGFTAELADMAAPHDAATRHVRDAAIAYEHHHDVAAARNAMERAVLADPDDPSLRLAAAWLALEYGDRTAAVADVDAGLPRETEPNRRGQLLLWGARAATDGRRYRDEPRAAATTTPTSPTCSPHPHGGPPAARGSTS